MADPTSPNMGLTLPNVAGSVNPSPGPTYANEQNINFGILLDQHNHTAGKGLQVPTAGLNLNAPTPLNGNPLTQVGWIILTPPTGSGESAGVPTATLAVYTDGTDIWFKDGSGNLIQITKSGAVNAGGGSGGTFTNATGINFTVASENFTQTALNHASTPYTVLTTDSFLRCDTTAGVLTINLPASASIGTRQLNIKDATGEALVHNITIVPNGGDTIDGQASVILTSPYQSLTLTSDSAGNWMLT